ncbi:MAG: DUF6353 family protein [Bacteroides sp.]
MQDFVHLHVHTQYSILDGQASISKLVDKAIANGMRGLAITDHGNMFGIKEFFNYTTKKNGGINDEIKNLKKKIAGLEKESVECEDKEVEITACRTKIEELKKKLSNSTPEILVGLGLVGFATSTIMAVKSTPKALQLIEVEREIREENKEPEMTKMDIVGIAWKQYIPSIVFYTLSSACIFGSTSIINKRNTAIVAAYKLTEKAYTEYKDAVIEQIGSNEEREIVEKINTRKMKDTPYNETLVVGTGDVVIYDSLSGRYFKSTLLAVEKAVVDINFRIINDMYASINDFYELLDIEYTETGFDMGWNLDNKMEVYYSSRITDDGQPCIVLNYEKSPIVDFDKIK